MTTKTCITIAACLLALSSNALHGQGERIILHLKSVEQMAGEIFLVNDSVLVFGKWGGRMPQLAEIKIPEIEKVVFKKEPKVTLLFHDGRRVNGELREINDSSMVVYKRRLRDPQNHNSEYVTINSEVKNYEIWQVIIKGKKNAGKGAIIGFGLGFLAGTVIGFAEGADPTCESRVSASDIWGRFACGVGEAISPPQSAGQKAMSYGLGLGLGGMTIGWIAGKATSTRDKEIQVSTDSPFSMAQLLAGFTRDKAEDK